MSKIGVVIPYFQNKFALNRCLDRLESQSLKVTEVYVRDNTNDNILFTAAVNEGIKKLNQKQYDAILILNQDCYLNETAVFELVTSLLKNEKYGISSPIQVRRGSSRVTWGGSLDAFPMGVHQCKGIDDYLEDFDTYWANGAAMMLKSDLISEIGLLDRNMKFICSDADYSFTARSRGWGVRVSVKAFAEHEISSSGNIENLWLEKIKLDDMQYFIDKWLTGSLYKSIAFEGPTLTKLKIQAQEEKIKRAVRMIKEKNDSGII